MMAIYIVHYKKKKKNKAEYMKKLPAVFKALRHLGLFNTKFSPYLKLFTWKYQLRITTWFWVNLNEVL